MIVLNVSLVGWLLSPGLAYHSQTKRTNVSCTSTILRFNGGVKSVTGRWILAGRIYANTSVFHKQ